MKVNIEIDCSDVEEIFTHLSVIRQQLRKKFKTMWKEHPDKQWEPFTVEDNNCYGVHTCEVIDDVGPFIEKQKDIL